MAESHRYFKAVTFYIHLNFKIVKSSTSRTNCLHAKVTVIVEFEKLGTLKIFSFIVCKENPFPKLLAVVIHKR